MQRSDIATLMPHQGDMMLLDRLEDWSQDSITCLGWTPGVNAHPLREITADGAAFLPASAALEYCAQAIALHGILKGQSGETGPKSALIAGLQNVRWHDAPLNEAHWPIRLFADAVGGLGDAGAKYAFRAEDQSSTALIRGEALVMFSAAPPA